MATLNMENVKTINNVKFNDKKTNELLENLKEGGQIVGLEDLAHYIRKQGLIVKEHIGRKRNYVEINPKVFGVDVNEKGDELKEFFKQHLQMGKLNFIPKEDEKKLVNIESSLRMQRRRACIGYDDSFMTLDSYEAFKKEFDEKKKEYFQVRDSILTRWDVLMNRFKEILWISLEQLNAIDKSSLFKTIMAKVPSKDDYKNSFYMELSLKAFPVTENLDMFRDDIKDQIQDGLNADTVGTLYEIIGNTLDDAFENVSKVLEGIGEHGKVANKTLGAVKKTAERIAQKNIFNNPKIDEIKTDILEMTRQGSDVDAIAEYGENILAEIYGYAHELGIDSCIKSLYKSPLSAEELEEVYERLASARTKTA